MSKMWGGSLWFWERAAADKLNTGWVVSQYISITLGTSRWVADPETADQLFLPMDLLYTQLSTLQVWDSSFWKVSTLKYQSLKWSNHRDKTCAILNFQLSGCYFEHFRIIRAQIKWAWCHHWWQNISNSNDILLTRSSVQQLCTELKEELFKVFTSIHFSQP